jgi:uncharacterized protein YjiS (DUF1127 family)
MSTMSQAAARPAISLNSSGLLRWFGAGAFALAAYLDRRAAMKTLRQMDDRELRDIGLTRSHIEQAVCGVPDPDLGRLR